MLYAQWLGRKIYQIPKEDDSGWERTEFQPSISVEIPIEERPDLPSTFMSFAPIVIHVILIIFNTVLSALKLDQVWAKYLRWGVALVLILNSGSYCLTLNVKNKL